MPLDPHLFLAFLLTSVVALVPPGPDMVFVLGCGMRGGPRAGLVATAGVATSETLHIAVAAAGLAALFEAAPAAFVVVKVAGAAYLVYLGVRMIRRRGEVPADEAPLPRRRAYLSGVLTNLVNPKMVTFTIAFLPQFVNPSLGHVTAQFALLGAVFVALEFLVDGTVGVLAGRIGGWLRRRASVRRRIDVVTGGVFIALGVRLAAES